MVNDSNFMTFIHSVTKTSWAAKLRALKCLWRSFELHGEVSISVYVHNDPCSMSTVHSVTKNLHSWHPAQFRFDCWPRLRITMATWATESNCLLLCALESLTHVIG
jgi:hypothetical protein